MKEQSFRDKYNQSEYSEKSKCLNSFEYLDVLVLKNKFSACLSVLKIEEEWITAPKLLSRYKR